LCTQGAKKLSLLANADDFGGIPKRGKKGKKELPEKCAFTSFAHLPLSLGLRLSDFWMLAKCSP